MHKYQAQCLLARKLISKDIYLQFFAYTQVFLAASILLTVTDATCKDPEVV